MGSNPDARASIDYVIGNGIAIAKSLAGYVETKSGKMIAFAVVRR